MTQGIDGKLTVVNAELPLLPLKDIVVFPNMIVPVFINEDLCINAVESALEGERKIFLSAFQVMGQDGEGLESKLDAPFDVYDIGTVCSIMRTRKLPDGRMKVLVQGLHKAVVQELLETEPYPKVALINVQDPTLMNSSSEVEALVRAVRENLEKVVSLGKVLSPDILMILEDVSEPGRLADLVASNLGLKVNEAQSILAVNNPVDRLNKVYTCLSREIEVYQMQVRIQSHAKDEIGRMQREHYLREQMRAIKSELGDTDGKDELDQFWQKLEELPLNKEAKEEVARQLKRLERMHQDTSEAALTRTHVETLLAMPWGKKSRDNLDIRHAKQILDEDHYGLEKVKDRIIEHLAVKSLNPNAKSPIICFFGPPGVGKTSLGRSIARSLGREFQRIALGGVRDEADIRGHRKTYVGAYPGRIMSAIKSSGSSNPVIMLDEIDKLASDHRGDPSSALLEVLDPEQNKKFVDHYLGIPFDLSDVVFIANANTLDTIPAPLRDRLEIIEVSGYSEEEKVNIANQYLIPKQIKEAGLDKEKLSFSKNSVSAIINGYTRESGLRGLEKKIASICRKVARKYAEVEEKERTDMPRVKLTPTLVQKHLGAEKFGDNFYHENAQIGVSLGLAYTQYGGEVMAIESSLIRSGKPRLVLTGKLGDVMKESAQAALSFIRAQSEEFGVDVSILEECELHVHVPAGAVPKDGPSAGIAMATSILSALGGKEPKEKVAMTGEITIHGKVLAIGGLREKLLAAQREGMKEVVVPMKNKPNYSELPASLKRNLKVHFVTDYNEVFKILFGSMNKSGASFRSVPESRDKGLAS
ncbi:endopeptidase La [Pseudobacteriovorax antillogorgiicola]|uniref:Lon protease n=1 Tax=Pseudobacteriovorax antillogorgiicola TaxID=1513793 RepID=A0A1Y6BA56_9BACT|nr:endopeptidase La [Pseudobacteriovorax antillogorgiicola]TCS59289.1 ATP-dependent proteinase [Pseudobacteriovorax antillogorgiicola]SME89703.1 ATP-dependent Lon protease [Pseudobacteriovorax antillogorgiicola]